MKRQLYFLLLIILISSTPISAEPPIVGEWVSAERSKEGSGSTKIYTADNVVQATFGTLVDCKYKLDGDKLTLSFPGADDVVQKLEIKDTKMVFTSKTTGDKQELTRIAGDPTSGIVGKWTGDHSTGKKQFLDFTLSGNCYLSVPMIETKGTYQVKDDNLIESLEGQNKTEWKWGVHHNILRLINILQGTYETYLRKK